MNKSEKLIVVLLGLALAGWIWHSIGEQKKIAVEQARRAAVHPAVPQTVAARTAAKSPAVPPTREGAQEAKAVAGRAEEKPAANRPMPKMTVAQEPRSGLRDCAMVLPLAPAGS